MANFTNIVSYKLVDPNKANLIVEEVKALLKKEAKIKSKQAKMFASSGLNTAGINKLIGTVGGRGNYNVRSSDVMNIIKTNLIDPIEEKLLVEAEKQRQKVLASAAQGTKGTRGSVSGNLISLFSSSFDVKPMFLRSDEITWDRKSNVKEVSVAFKFGDMTKMNKIALRAKRGSSASNPVPVWMLLEFGSMSRFDVGSHIEQLKNNLRYHTELTSSDVVSGIAHKLNLAMGPGGATSSEFVQKYIRQIDDFRMVKRKPGDESVAVGRYGFHMIQNAIFSFNKSNVVGNIIKNERSRFVDMLDKESSNIIEQAFK